MIKLYYQDDWVTIYHGDCAAKDLQRKCTLIEIDECYCEIAAQRMLQEVLPL